MPDRLSAQTIPGSKMTQLLLQYSYLQVLDFLTTVAFMAIGVQEGNPVVRLVITMLPSPLGGLLAVKVVAMILGLYCWRMGRQQLLSRINIGFALLVAWNLVALIVGAAGSRAA